MAAYCQLLLLLFALLMTYIIADMPPYHYKRYPYKKKQRSERKIRSLRASCEQDLTCEQTYGLERLACVRKCMSAECYMELYGQDELEEGEIDVRINSYKGCILQHSSSVVQP